MREACRQLAALGIPETIEHGDLHDGQVFVRDGAYRFADWADATVSHPFFTMSVTLEGVLAWGIDDIQGSHDTRAFASAYLEPFTRYAPQRELEAGLATACRLGWISRALSTLASVDRYPTDDRPKQVERAAVHLRMFLDPDS